MRSTFRPAPSSSTDSTTSLRSWLRIDLPMVPMAGLPASARCSGGSMPWATQLRQQAARKARASCASSIARPSHGLAHHGVQALGQRVEFDHARTQQRRAHSRRLCGLGDQVAPRHPPMSRCRFCAATVANGRTDSAIMRVSSCTRVKRSNSSGSKPAAESLDRPGGLHLLSPDFDVAQLHAQALQVAGPARSSEPTGLARRAFERRENGDQHLAGLAASGRSRQLGPNAHVCWAPPRSWRRHRRGAGRWPRTACTASGGDRVSRQRRRPKTPPGAMRGQPSGVSWTCSPATRKTSKPACKARSKCAQQRSSASAVGDCTIDLLHRGFEPGGHFAQARWRQPERSTALERVQGTQRTTSCAPTSRPAAAGHASGAVRHPGVAAARRPPPRRCGNRCRDRLRPARRCRRPGRLPRPRMGDAPRRCGAAARPRGETSLTHAAWSRPRRGCGSAPRGASTASGPRHRAPRGFGLDGRRAASGHRDLDYSRAARPAMLLPHRVRRLEEAAANGAAARRTSSEAATQAAICRALPALAAAVGQRRAAPAGPPGRRTILKPSASARLGWRRRVPCHGPPGIGASPSARRREQRRLQDQAPGRTDALPRLRGLAASPPGQFPGSRPRTAPGGMGRGDVRNAHPHPRLGSASASPCTPAGPPRAPAGRSGKWRQRPALAVPHGSLEARSPVPRRHRWPAGSASEAAGVLRLCTTPGEQSILAILRHGGRRLGVQEVEVQCHVQGRQSGRRMWSALVSPSASASASALVSPAARNSAELLRSRGSATVSVPGASGAFGKRGTRATSAPQPVRGRHGIVPQPAEGRPCQAIGLAALYGEAQAEGRRQRVAGQLLQWAGHGLLLGQPGIEHLLAVAQAGFAEFIEADHARAALERMEGARSVVCSLRGRGCRAPRPGPAWACKPLVHDLRGPLSRKMLSNSSRPSPPRDRQARQQGSVGSGSALPGLRRRKRHKRPRASAAGAGCGLWRRPGRFAPFRQASASSSGSATAVGGASPRPGMRGAGAGSGGSMKPPPPPAAPRAAARQRLCHGNARAAAGTAARSRAQTARRLAAFIGTVAATAHDACAGPHPRPRHRTKELARHAALVAQHVDQKAHGAQAVAKLVEDWGPVCLGDLAQHQPVDGLAHALHGLRGLVQAQHREHAAHLCHLARHRCQHGGIRRVAEVLVQVALGVGQGGAQLADHGAHGLVVAGLAAKNLALGTCYSKRANVITL
ncbi:hypothetical protein FQR65_LT20134 [Abscondita terminalis]|nr:hypothetical protein FQR65_LT20134 [Abscondita terminalis]